MLLNPSTLAAAMEAFLAAVQDSRSPNTAKAYCQALHGLLTKIRDLNLILISVQRFNSGTNKLEEVPIQLKQPGSSQ